MLRAFTGQLALAVERRRLRAEAAAAEGLAEANELRTALLVAVSHDLRTPLSSIKASVTSLRQRDVTLTPDDRGELLETIDGEADRLNNLVGNLLDMSRIQTGSVELVEREVGLEEVVPAALPQPRRGHRAAPDPRRRTRGVASGTGRHRIARARDRQRRRQRVARVPRGPAHPHLRRRAAGSRRAVDRGRRPRHPRRQARSGVPTLPAVGDQPAATASASASPSRAGSSRRWTAPSPSRTPPAAGPPSPSPCRRWTDLHASPTGEDLARCSAGYPLRDARSHSPALAPAGAPVSSRASATMSDSSPKPPPERFEYAIAITRITNAAMEMLYRAVLS